MGGSLCFGDALVPTLGITWTPTIGRFLMEGYQLYFRRIGCRGEGLKIAVTSGDVGGVIVDVTSFVYLASQAYGIVHAAVEMRLLRSADLS
uniref:Uncharacterized protein n=1 Tax=Physcomitrium patens TaxID=3218 RepID=A0A2K1J169_PHYPA|nr:hypothetical protein PHYPA_023174 [Physcomitrium patens]